LVEQTIFFIVTGSGGSYSVAVITDYLGRAPLGNIPLPPGSYSVTAYYNGQIPKPGGGFFTSLDDPRYLPVSSAPAVLSLVSPPSPLDCSTARPSIATIWPANNKFVTVKVLGVTTQTGKPARISISSIFQDEPVGKEPHTPDGKGREEQQAQVRAERDGKGNGRVYHISFNAADGKGGLCSGKVRVAVHHDQGVGIDAIDGGPLYDSTKK
jgi:hypothetical protein